MKAFTTYGQSLAVLAALSSTVAAWPQWLPPADALVVRQNSGSSSAASSTPASQGSTATSVPASVTSPPSSTTNTAPNEPNTTGNLNTGGVSQTGQATATDGGNKTSTKTHQMFDPQSPAGGVNIILPTTTAGTVLYRIGETISLKWNYTSLLGSPTAVDVMLTASPALTYTLTQNMTFDPTATFTWDTNQYKQTALVNPLLTTEYNLLIYDSDGSPSSVPDAGYLQPFSQFKFGLYASKPYNNLSDWHCVTCNSANGKLDSHALGFAFTMAAITVLSFTWFVTGLGGLP